MLRGKKFGLFIFLIWISFVYIVFYADIEMEFALLDRMIDLFAAALIFLTCLLLGSYLIKSFPDEDRSPSEFYLISVGLGVGILAILILLLGVFGLYTANGNLVIFAFLSFIIYRGRYRILEFWAVLGNAVIERKRKLLQLNFFEKVLLVIFGAQIIFHFLLALTPPDYWDDLMYHLAIPNAYLKAGRITGISHILWSNYPLTLEMLYLLGMMLVSDIVPKLISCTFGLLAALLVYRIVRRWINPKYALLSTVLFYTMGLVKYLSASAHVELGLIFIELLGIHALLCYIEKPRLSRALLAGVFAGFAFGIKYDALFFIATMGLLLLFNYAKNRRSRETKPKFGHIVGFSLVILLASSPWLIKNMIIANNPVFPLFYNIFGGNYWTQEGVKDWTEVMRKVYGGEGRTLLGYFTFFFDLTMFPSDEWANQTPPIFVAFIPALLLLKSIPRYAKWLLGAAIIYYTFYYSFYSLHARFLIFVYTLLCILVAIVVIELYSNSGRALKIVVSLAVIASILFPNNYFLFRYVSKKIIPVIVGEESRTAFLMERSPIFRVSNYINTHLASGMKVLGLNERCRYYIEEKDILMMPPEIDPIFDTTDTLNVEEVLGKLKLHETRFILVRKKPGFGYRFIPWLQRAYFNKEYEDDNYALFKVRSHIWFGTGG